MNDLERYNRDKASVMSMLKFILDFIGRGKRIIIVQMRLYRFEIIFFKNCRNIFGSFVVGCIGWLRCIIKIYGDVPKSDIMGDFTLLFKIFVIRNLNCFLHHRSPSEILVLYFKYHNISSSFAYRIFIFNNSIIFPILKIIDFF